MRINKEIEGGSWKVPGNYEAATSIHGTITLTTTIALLSSHPPPFFIICTITMYYTRSVFLGMDREKWK